MELTFKIKVYSYPRAAQYYDGLAHNILEKSLNFLRIVFDICSYSFKTFHYRLVYKVSSKHSKKKKKSGCYFLSHFFAQTVVNKFIIDNY